MEKQGVIYILTNPSFPDYVKIGYADDVKARVAQLNRSECTPYAFRIYATYEVASRLSDKKVHQIIDKLNPDLRSKETFNGKERIREFYAMPPEKAYSIFEAIAEIHDTKEKLIKYELTKEESKEEHMAQTVEAEATERRSPFSFFKCGIPVGAEICFIKDNSKVCYVVDDRHVEYNGITMSLTALAKELLGTTGSIAGPLFFMYEGERLVDVRYRLGV